MSDTGFVIIDAKANEAQFDQSMEWSTELIDYENHPAYQSLFGKGDVTLRFKAMLQFLRSIFPLILKRLIKYEMIPIEIRNPASLSGYGFFAITAVRNALGLHSRNRIKNHPSKVFSTLENNGVCVVQIPDERFTELAALAKPHFDRLEKRRSKRTSGNRSFEESRSNVDARKHGDELYQTIENILKDSGIIDAASQYLGRDAHLIDVNPQINDSSDSFWRKIFPDLPGLKLPETAYFHRDASGGDLKAIIYMTDVNIETGPFSYVVGSNKLNLSRFDDLVAEANDHNGLSATTLEARKRFTKLPRKFRQKGAFGNDLIEGSRLAHEVKQGTWQITSKCGSIVLFDTKGIHRGGMVTKGERRVITNVIG